MNGNTSAAAAAATVDTLTPAEQEVARLFLKQTLDGVAGAIHGLTPGQWTFAPDSGAWSPALITEHLIFVLERVLGPLREQLMNTPAIAAGPVRAAIDVIVIHQFPSRLKRFTSPEFAIPFGRFASAVEARPALDAIPARAEEYLSTPGLREHGLESMPIKLVTNGAHTMLDGYQWLLAAIAHAERHTKQILEVKSAPNFPPG